MSPHYCNFCGAEAERDTEGVVRHVRSNARHCDLDDDCSLSAEIDDDSSDNA